MRRMLLRRGVREGEFLLRTYGSIHESPFPTFPLNFHRVLY